MAEQEGNQQERTEQATPKRRKDARKEGKCRKKYRGKLYCYNTCRYGIFLVRRLIYVQSYELLQSSGL